MFVETHQHQLLSRRVLNLVLVIIMMFLVHPALSFVTLEEEPDWTGTNDEQGAEYGFTVGLAGDVNGDGYDDAFVGAPRHSLGQYRAGAVFVYHGGAGGLSSTANWSFAGTMSGSRFGAAVSSAGDVNGDGFDDLLVGAPRSNQDYPEAGKLFLFHGGPGGLADTPSWEKVGDQPEALLGSAVASAGDVNNDGYADVLAGAGWYDGAAFNGGAAFLWLGSPTGLGEEPAWLVNGSGAGDGLGWSVAGAGDVNGDGYDDVLVGAPYTDGEMGDDAGRALLYRGQSTGVATMPAWSTSGGHAYELRGMALAPAGDTNNDGYADFLVGAPGYADGTGTMFLFGVADSTLIPETLWQWICPYSGAQFATTVSGGMDVNGDGHIDILAGAPYYMDDQPQEGGVFIYYGTGLGSFTSGWEAMGNKAEAHFGWAAASAGDVNQDGFTDVIAGAPDFRQSTILVGRAFGYYGRDDPADLYPVYLPLLTK